MINYQWRNGEFMRKIKLVMSDVDGTLINDNHKVSEQTKITVQKLINSGIEFGIATGRNYEGALDIVKQLDLDPKTIPIISLNGLHVDHPELEYHFKDKTIDYETCKIIGDIGRKYYMGVLYFFKDKAYSQMDDLSLKDYEYSKGTDRMHFFEDGHQIERIESIEDISHVFTPDHEVLKIVFIQDNDYTELIKERISSNFPEDFDLLMVADGWAEIMPKSVNKGKAILEYANFRGLDSSEILAFGDSDNDLTMINSVGKGIAMKNARNSLKVLANDITDTNNNDGVAKYLEKHLLSNID